jgi:hypothetical protein
MNNTILYTFTNGVEVCAQTYEQAINRLKKMGVKVDTLQAMNKVPVDFWAYTNPPKWGEKGIYSNNITRTKTPSRKASNQ